MEVVVAKVVAKNEERMELLLNVKKTYSKLFNRSASHVSAHVVLAIGLFGAMGATTIATTSQAYAASSCSKEYTIKHGDTLSGIAQRYKTNVKTLATNNGIANPDLIYAGNKLCVDGVSANAAVVQQPAQSTSAQPSAPTTTVPQPGSSAPVTTTQPAPATQSTQSTTTQQTTGVVSGSVTSMIEQVFGANSAAAINIATCESGLNPSATNAYSGAAGLFQIMPGTWSTTSQAASSPYNAYANIVAAHDIFVRDGNSWAEWTCQP
jgi:LysM repeat protein